MQKCDELYELLLVRNPEITRTIDYTTVKHVLLMRLVNIVITKIDYIGEESCKRIDSGRIPEIIQQMKEMLNEIYSSCLRNLSDENHIGLINVFLFQCVILFTKHLGVIHEFYIPRLIDVWNTFSTGWMDYNDTKRQLSITPTFNRLVLIQEGVPYTLENLSKRQYNEYGIFLIKWINGFDSDTVIKDYLNNVFYCEIVSHATYADGRCVAPFEYLYHDISHGVNFLYGCGEERMSLDLNTMEQFYNFVKNLMEEGRITLTKFKKIKALIFYELHEGECYLGRSVKSTVIENEKYSRFDDVNDLKLLIPSSINTRGKIKKYFENAIELFKEYYDEFSHSPKTLGNHGFRKRRKTRKSRK